MRVQDALGAFEHGINAVRMLASLTAVESDAYSDFLASAYADLAGACRNAGKIETAWQELDKALDYLQRMALVQPEVFEPKYATALSNTALLLLDRSPPEVDLAAEKISNAIKIKEEWYRRDRFFFAHTLSYSYMIQATIHQCRRQFEEANGIRRKVVEMLFPFSTKSNHYIEELCAAFDSYAFFGAISGQVPDSDFLSKIEDFLVKKLDAPLPVRLAARERQGQFRVLP